MPLPRPRKREKQNDFISRCMGVGVMKREYKKLKQRVAVCFSEWRRVKK